MELFLRKVAHPPARCRRQAQAFDQLRCRDRHGAPLEREAVPCHPDDSLPHRPDHGPGRALRQDILNAGIGGVAQRADWHLAFCREATTRNAWVITTPGREHLYRRARRVPPTPQKNPAARDHCGRAQVPPSMTTSTKVMERDSLAFKADRLCAPRCTC